MSGQWVVEMYLPPGPVMRKLCFQFQIISLECSPHQPQAHDKIYKAVYRFPYE